MTARLSEAQIAEGLAVARERSCVGDGSWEDRYAQALLDRDADLRTLAAFVEWRGMRTAHGDVYPDNIAAILAKVKP